MTNGINRARRNRLCAISMKQMPASVARAGGAALRCCRVLVAGHAVDALTDQIGVAVVARVLLDHVQVDPPDVAIGATPLIRHDIIEALAGPAGGYQGWVGAVPAA